MLPSDFYWHDLITVTLLAAKAPLCIIITRDDPAHLVGKSRASVEAGPAITNLTSNNCFGRPGKVDGGTA